MYDLRMQHYTNKSNETKNDLKKEVERRMANINRELGLINQLRRPDYKVQLKLSNMLADYKRDLIYLEDNIIRHPDFDPNADRQYREYFGNEQR